MLKFESIIKVIEPHITALFYQESAVERKHFMETTKIFPKKQLFEN